MKSNITAIQAFLTSQGGLKFFETAKPSSQNKGLLDDEIHITCQFQGLKLFISLKGGLADPIVVYSSPVKKVYLPETLEQKSYNDFSEFINAFLNKEKIADGYYWV